MRYFLIVVFAVLMMGCEQAVGPYNETVRVDADSDGLACIETDRTVTAKCGGYTGINPMSPADVIYPDGEACAITQPNVLCELTIHY